MPAAMIAPMSNRAIMAALFLIFGTLPVAAQNVCRAEVNQTEVLIDRDAFDAMSGRAGLAERARAWPSRGLSRLKGQPPACDSQTLIAYLAAEVPDADIEGYCLLSQPDSGYILVPGARNYRGHCSKTTCDRVNAAAKSAGAIAGTATDIVTGRDNAAGQSRTGAVIHASGAAILSGSAAGILSTLGTGASAAVTAALAAPAVAGAAAVSVVAIGGSVYLCR